MIEAKMRVGKFGRELLKSCEGLRIIWQLLLLGIVASSALAAPKKPERSRAPESAAAASAVLWRNPADISSRNLFYGPGGKRHVPPSTFIFVKEDGKGSNPKFVVRDASGVRWNPEARPEIAATRLVWAAGYFANEDYYLGLNEAIENGGFAISRSGNRRHPFGALRALF